MILTLTIKKQYFDLINDGSKVVEIRKDSDYYRRLLWREANAPKYLILHYQSIQKLVCAVENIALINNYFDPRPEFLGTDKVFEIRIRKIEVSTESTDVLRSRYSREFKAVGDGVFT